MFLIIVEIFEAAIQFRFIQIAHNKSQFKQQQQFLKYIPETDKLTNELV